MDKPELIFVVGCNAAGKSTFIRTRLSELGGFKILMTDVYKEQTKRLAELSIHQRGNVILETVFNDGSFKDLIDLAKNTGYHTSLVVLFLDNLSQSIARVATRGMQQSGIMISGNNIKLNFYESFKNVSKYFYYFDRADFFYTGVNSVNHLIMSFNNSSLVAYKSNDLVYPQKFANYSLQRGYLDQKDYEHIVTNVDFTTNLINPSLSKFNFLPPEEP